MPGRSFCERDGPGTFRERQNDSKHGTDVSFTLVCNLSKSGVSRTVGCLSVARLPRRVGRVVSDGPSRKETDLQPFGRDETKQNQTRACHLPSFVTSPNLGSSGPSVASLLPVYRGGGVSGRDGGRDGVRRTWDPSRETERDKTGHGRVVYPRLSPLKIWGRLGSRLACRLPFTVG